MPFDLRFDLSKIPFWASRYPITPMETRIIEDIGSAVRTRGSFTKCEFREVCAWKTPRSKRRCAANDEAYVRSVTASALSSPNDRLRIEVVTLLDGVSW